MNPDPSEVTHVPAWLLLVHAGTFNLPPEVYGGLRYVIYSEMGLLVRQLVRQEKIR